MEDTYFTKFDSDISNFEIPKQFNFPFFYTPSEIAKKAATALQKRLEKLEDIEHNFGLEEDQEGLVIGKMFGVLVVETLDSEIGYLSAFSGKLGSGNHHFGFVPPVFDILDKEGFFIHTEQDLNVLNKSLGDIEKNEEYITLRAAYKRLKQYASEEVLSYKDKMKRDKASRKVERSTLHMLDESEKLKLEATLINESLKQQFLLKELIIYWDEKVQEAKEKFKSFTDEIKQLKNDRKNLSNYLQQRIFESYSFLNANGEVRSLNSIFTEELGIIPPGGSGECAAPKLLQFAYINQLKPIALAEFWWGASPSSNVRKHGHFYPACRSKCEPILGHMLKGLDVEENVMLHEPILETEIEIIYEDEYFVAINKPHDFLSVPGKVFVDSIHARMLKKFPNATGPLIVHRLDMSTSGIMLIPLTKEIHQNLQAQFTKRKVKKQYVAILEGIIENKEGTIDLPLSGDINHRPHQMVNYKYGKPAVTNYEVIRVDANRTKVHFYPITGRTHQLRVHASHSLGLNCPIVGDDLYGIPDERLFLHAESIEFMHPVTKEVLKLKVPCPF